ncbi:MAG: SagB family peptide dehydrogenase, partial [Desulfobacterales bacterium]|nr:SagB family peptide dehydrogenase [Desulfobacterales bacterium]
MAKTGNSAAEYHWGQAHIRHRISPHTLDFNHYPLPFKPYSDAVRVSLKTESGSTPETGSLAELLFFAYGVTGAGQAGGIPFFRRTVPSAGGLYPCHLYLGISSAAGSGPDETGVYYYDPVQACLVQLRKGEGAGPVKAGGPAAGEYRVLFMITASFYNSAWKYRGRAYRYMLLDAGHLVRNLELVLGGPGMSCRVDYDFDDKGVGELLDLDMDAEVPLACVTSGWDNSVSDITGQLTEKTEKELPGPETRPFELQSMKDYGVLRQIHTSGIPVQEVSEVKRREITEHLPVATLDIDSPSLKEKAQKTPVSPKDELGHLLAGRRSRRNFTASPVSRDALRVLAEWLGKGVDAGGRVASTNILETGMVCRNLEGLEDGFYLFDRGFTR